MDDEYLRALLAQREQVDRYDWGASDEMVFGGDGDAVCCCYGSVALDVTEQQAAAWIARAHNAIPALVAEIRRLQANAKSRDKQPTGRASQ